MEAAAFSVAGGPACRGQDRPDKRKPHGGGGALRSVRRGMGAASAPALRAASISAIQLRRLQSFAQRPSRRARRDRMRAARFSKCTANLKRPASMARSMAK